MKFHNKFNFIFILFFCFNALFAQENIKEKALKAFEKEIEAIEKRTGQRLMNTKVILADINNDQQIDATVEYELGKKEQEIVLYRYAICYLNTKKKLKKVAKLEPNYCMGIRYIKKNTITLNIFHSCVSEEPEIIDYKQFKLINNKLTEIEIPKGMIIE